MRPFISTLMVCFMKTLISRYTDTLWYETHSLKAKKKKKWFTQKSKPRQKLFERSAYIFYNKRSDLSDIIRHVYLKDPC